MLRTRSSKPFGRPIIVPGFDRAMVPLKKLVSEQITQRTQVGLAVRVRGCSGRREWSMLDSAACAAGQTQDVTLAVRTDGITYPISYDPGPSGAVAGYSAASESHGDTAAAATGSLLIVRAADVVPEGAPQTYSCHGYDARTGFYIGPWSVIAPALLAAIAAGMVYDGPVDGDGHPVCEEPDPVSAIRWGARYGSGEA